MSPAHYYRNCRRFHARYKLRYRESCLNITADCIENYEQSLDTSVLFDRYKSRNNVLVFGSLVLLRENVVPLNLTYHGKTMYEMLGIPMELYTPLFAIARITGWSAHRIEELVSMEKIIRPAYKSLMVEREYVPRDQR